MAKKPSVAVRERKLTDGRIRLCYDIYSRGQRELRTDENPIYLLATDSLETIAEKREKASLKAAELELAVRKNEYTFRKPASKTSLGSSLDIESYPTFLKLFEAEAARRSNVLAEKQVLKIQRGRQVHKKRYDDVYYCLQRFKAFLNTKGKTDLHYQDLTPRLLEQFKDYLLAEVNNGESKFCRNTASAYLKKFKTVALIGYREGFLTAKVAHSVPTIKLSKFERTYLSEPEVTILLEDLYANPTDTLFKRAFLFSCMASLRFGDLVTITWGHIKGGKLVFRPGKNDDVKELRLKLNTTALALIGERQDDKQAIFPVKYNSALNDKLNLWILTNGIRKGRITWHSGRHTCATMLLRKTGNITAVQKILGHSKPQTTLLYAQMESEELDNALDSIDIDLPESGF